MEREEKLGPATGVSAIPSRRTGTPEPPAQPKLDELDRVSIRVDVRSDEDAIVPAGSTGTVVAVWNGGEAYEIEFDDPSDALATVQPEAIGAVVSRHR